MIRFLSRKEWLMLVGIIALCGIGLLTSKDFFAVWSLPRIWLGAVLGLVGLVLLARSVLKRSLRLALQFVAFFVFSVIAVLPLGNFAQGLGLHPSPMCLIEKPFFFIHAGRAVPAFFFSFLLFVVIMTVIGNKLFCGWNCPLGAAQEILHAVPLPKKFKIRLPFWFTNSLRVVVFITFILLLYLAGFSLYAYINAFEFMHWRFSILPFLPFIVTMIIALFIYRPFCYLLCPLGLFTWLFEHRSFYRIQVEKQTCNDCRICVAKSPCPCMPAILQQKFSRPDCHACGRCIELCPEKALQFKK
jgi:polyferredoxin